MVDVACVIEESLVLDVKMLVMNLQKRKWRHKCFKNIKLFKSISITLNSYIKYIDSSYRLMAYCTRLVRFRRKLVMYSNLCITVSNFYLWLEIFISCYVYHLVHYHWHFLCKHRISLPHSHNGLFYSTEEIA